MLDPRAIAFDPARIEGITLIQDLYMGLGVVTELNSSFVIGSLAPQTQFEAIFFNPEEGPGPRFYVPNCNLFFDLASAATRSDDPLPGSLIVAEKGISLMVKPPRTGPSPLRLTGEPISHPYEGICFNSWRIETPHGLGKPHVLYARESTDLRAAQ